MQSDATGSTLDPVNKEDLEHVHTQSPLNPDIAQHESEEAAAMTPSKIKSVLWILVGITAIEFTMALVLIPRHFIPHNLANYLYILLTLFKAFYIVGYFMHLKFERITLIYCIAVPCILIIGLIAGLISEGHHWAAIR